MGLILVSNPGSASRKYALFDTDTHKQRAALHIETTDGKLVGTLRQGESAKSVSINVDSLSLVPTCIRSIFRENGVLKDDEKAAAIGLRIVAPGEYFMRDHIINDEVIEKIKEVLPFDAVHVSGTLSELDALRNAYPTTPIVLVSDSAFHANKPSYAWNYGINLQDADKYEIKRFGFHGLSVSAAVNVLWDRGKLPPKVIVCHLGSGSSVSAVFNGRSVDNSMGYSSLEGVVMATRSGTIGYTAALALQKKLGFNEEQMEHYLDEQGGLFGLAGSNDLREIIKRESDGDHIAHLALDTLTHSIHKAIGSMAAVLNGVDLIVFTGTIGERSFTLRKRIIARLEYLDFIIDGVRNSNCTEPTDLTSISQAAISKPIIVIPTNESYEIVKHCTKMLNL